MPRIRALGLDSCLRVETGIIPGTWEVSPGSVGGIQKREVPGSGWLRVWKLRPSRKPLPRPPPPAGHEGAPEPRASRLPPAGPAAWDSGQAGARQVGAPRAEPGQRRRPLE